MPPFPSTVTWQEHSSLIGRMNVKNEELEEMIKEAPGAINFTVFLTMFGEKLKGKWEPVVKWCAQICVYKQFPESFAWGRAMAV